MADKNCEYILKYNICGSERFGGGRCNHDNYKICNKYEEEKYLERAEKNLPAFVKKTKKLFEKRGDDILKYNG